MILPKPKHLGPEYGAQFSDPSVASAYCFRPSYPDEVYTILERLLGDTPRCARTWCGLGEIAQRFAPQTDRVDAVGLPTPAGIGSHAARWGSTGTSSGTVAPRRSSHICRGMAS